MKLQGKMIPSDDPVWQLLYITKYGISILHQYKPLNNDGEIEVQLFNSLLLKLFLQQEDEDIYDKSCDEFNVKTLAVVTTLGIDSFVPDTLDFVNNRNSFFISELEEIDRNEGWLPLKLYKMFYENPLMPNPSPSINFQNADEFHPVLFEMITELKKAVETLCLEQNTY